MKFLWYDSMLRYDHAWRGFVDESPMKSWWNVYPMEFQWNAYEIPMKSRWNFYGMPMNLRYSSEIPMKFLWYDPMLRSGHAWQGLVTLTCDATMPEMRLESQWKSYENSMEFLRKPYEIPMKFLSIALWKPCGIPMKFSGHSYEIPRASYELPMHFRWTSYIWASYELRMNFLWTSYVNPMKIWSNALWHAYDIPVQCSRHSNDIPMNVLWKSSEVVMKFLWTSHVSPMKFLWNSCELHMKILWYDSMLRSDHAWQGFVTLTCDVTMPEMRSDDT